VAVVVVIARAVDAVVHSTGDRRGGGGGRLKPRLEGLAALRHKTCLRRLENTKGNGCGRPAGTDAAAQSLESAQADLVAERERGHLGATSVASRVCQDANTSGEFNMPPSMPMCTALT
jgi:hypothetical protein